MLSGEFGAVFWGLSSAVVWGAADFSGGFASRRNSAFTVALYSQIVGAVMLIGLTILARESLPTGSKIIWAVMAGAAGAFGLLLFYYALGNGQMGIAAPVSALTAGVLPVLVGAIQEGLPNPLQLIGFAVALPAIWLISGGTTHLEVRQVWLPMTAGVCFGLFFVLIDRMTTDTIFAPFIITRVTSLIVIATVSFLLGQGARPTAQQMPVIALAGILDSLGNALFGLAAQAGRLDIAAVLSSLYPAATVMLAWFILKERLFPRQWLGVVAALGAVILIALPN